MATLNSLKLAHEHGLRSVVFPAISTGIFGFPLRPCSEIMLSTVLDWLRAHDLPQDIVFCLYDDAALQIFTESLRALTTQNA
jgi:O-acetyl-ADP-ribose deacetylase (regulator of RNase III)